MPDKQDRIREAYAAGAAVVQAEKDQEPDAVPFEELQRGGAGRIIVVRGQYDRAELVLEALKVPFERTDPQELGKLDLSDAGLMIVNCPGQLDERTLARLPSFVERGGTLVATDWTVKHVMERAFPGFVRHNGNSTADEVVRVELVRPDEPVVRGLIEAGEDPLWWLEGSSYPIDVLDPERVEILIRSKEVGERYGADPVAVRFRFGDGIVYQLLSHLYLQRSETRTARHAAPASDYLKQKGVAFALKEDLNTADIESATSSNRFMTRILREKARTERKSQQPKES